MKRLLFGVIFLTFLLSGCFGSRGYNNKIIINDKESQNYNHLKIAQLQKQKIDLKSENCITFFLFFESEDDEKAFINVMDPGYDCFEIEHLELIVAVYAKPDESTIEKITTKIFQASKQNHGDYYGWDIDTD
jgi:hypothetical protein